ncbi:MAG: efflux RND transporter permease subunit [Planctomycetes bacterium]|nr:efflux RND transporter permease subunit [Planctomycetota bacterium]
MILPDVSIRRPVGAVMITAALVLFGAIALARLPLREMPRMDFPVVTVTVAYPGASPEVVEEEVTDVLEEQINTVEGIRLLQSASGEGGAQITVQFALERDIDVAAQEVRDKIASVRRELPPEIDEPVVAKLDLDAQAILWIAVTATDRDRVEITEYADRVLKPALENLPGVGQILIGGAQKFAVRVWLDETALAARALTVSDVARALASQNAEIPSGRVEGADREFSVRTEGDLPTVASFEEVVLAHRGGAPVLLRDVAMVRAGPRDERATAHFSRLPDAVGRDAVGLGVLRQTEANTVEVARAVKERLLSLQRDLPPGMEATVAFDASVFVEESVAELRESLLAGGALAVAVVFLALASARAGLIVALSIPTSIVSTFALLYFLGFTINTLTMLALVLAVGMVVDDAIVVIENVVRLRRAGKGPIEAAREGASEIAFSVVASTLSIAVVFLPLAFVKGMVGRLFLEFALTVAGAILVSLLVSLTLIPMLASRFLGRAAGGRFERRVEAAFAAVSSLAERFLRLALRARWAVVAAAALLLVLSGGLLGGLGKEMSPAVDEGSFLLLLKGPQGATIDYTERYLRQAEREMAAVPEIATYFTAIGLGRGGLPKVNEGIAFLRLKPLPLRRAQGLRGQFEVMADLRGRFAAIAGFQVIVLPRPSIGSTGQGSPLQLVVMGPEVGDLYEASIRLREAAARIPGVVDVRTNLNLNKPSLRVLPDRARAADLGVDLAEVARTLRVLLGGNDAGRFTRGGERHDVMLRLEPGRRSVPEAIGALHVRSRDGTLVPLSSVVAVEEGVGPSEIHRHNRSRSFTLEANLEGVPLGSALEAVERVARDTLPASFRVEPSGTSQDMRESFASLAFTLALALCVIYMVLAAEFDHFVHPLTVMLSVPLALAGALGLLWALGQTVNLFSVIGMIMLAGIVTRNAILLVDAAIHLRASGGLGVREASARAARLRLRPILMTSASTLLGVLPALVGFGSGVENRRPLAAAVVGGMTVSTLLTLVVVPVVYTLLDDLGAWMSRRVARSRGTVLTADGL